MLTQLTSFAPIGLSCERITVEIGFTAGESDFIIVGLGDKAVQESKERVRLAMRNCGYKFPTSKNMIVNLAPADIRKIGPRFDLPIALGLLITHGQVEIPQERLYEMAFIGELALDGSLRHVSGVLSAAIACRKYGLKTLIVPAVNAAEASLIPGIEVIGAANLREVAEILLGEKTTVTHSATTLHELGPPVPLIDFADVRGQDHAKRALEIAAAGGHNVLLSGAPGAGKTLLARALPGILPPLTREEAIEVTQIYSVANQLAETSLVTKRPFRVVHHTASGVSIVGGGQVPGPGEISLAHRGVLFLDELAEFPSQVLEVLRQPLEDRQITITRAQGSVTFPADFILVAAMNPPQFGAGEQKIARRISPPLLDRIDLTIAVEPVPIEDLSRSPQQRSESSASILQRVQAARARQEARFKGQRISTNKEMSVQHIDTLCPLDAPSLKLLTQAAARLNLSARSYHRTIKVARTIADLEGAEKIEAKHVAEALQYRQNVGVG